MTKNDFFASARVVWREAIQNKEIFLSPLVIKNPGLPRRLTTARNDECCLILVIAAKPLVIANASAAWREAITRYVSSHRASTWGFVSCFCLYLGDDGNRPASYRADCHVPGQCVYHLMLDTPLRPTGRIAIRPYTQFPSL